MLPVLPKEVPALVNATDKSFVPTANLFAYYSLYFHIK
nr:MAG TPA: hypothetical protein [Caudoviricetes sp.]